MKDYRSTDRLTLSARQGALLADIELPSDALLCAGQCEEMRLSRKCFLPTELKPFPYCQGQTNA